MSSGGRLRAIAFAGLVAACTASPSVPPGSANPSIGSSSPTATFASSPQPSPTAATFAGLAAGWTGHLEPKFDGLQSAVVSRLGERELVAATTASGRTILTTRDGKTWIPATGLGFVADAVGGVAVGEALGDQASLPDARLVSVHVTAQLDATECGTPEPWRAAVWTSQDGSTWAEVPKQASFAHVPMLAISPAPTGLGYVAVGRLSHCSSSDGLTHSAAWSSKDGIGWTLTGSTSFGTAAVLDVDGWTAVGSDTVDDEYPGFAHPAIWRLNEPGGWRRVTAALGRGIATMVASVGLIVIVVGMSGAAGGGDVVPVEWIQDEDGAWTGPDPLAGFVTSVLTVQDPNGPWLLAAQGGQAVATRDGRSWVPLTPPGQAITAVGAWAGGVIALGRLNDQDPTGPGVVWLGPVAWPGR